MKKFNTEDIRNVIIAGGGDAGKTSLAESLLYRTGATTRFGSVDEGISILDYDLDEISRKISISSSVASFVWDKKKINLIDTPGYANFLADAYLAMRVVDGAIIVVSTIEGIKVETERIWKQADHFGLPRVVYLSGVDKDRSDFDRVMESLGKFYGNKIVPLVIPDGIGANFKGLIDLVNMSIIKPGADGSWPDAGIDLNEDEKAGISKLHEQLIETVAETRDDLLEKYLESGSIEKGDLLGALSAAVKQGLIYPVISGIAPIGAGAHQVLNAITSYLPSPNERGMVSGKKPGTDEEIKREPDESAPFSGLVFKTIADPYAGRLTIFRVYSGVLHSDTQFYNVNKESRERFGQIFSLLGKTQSGTSQVVAGDIAGVAKLKETTTGDTICDEKKPILFDFVSLPKPAISFAIEPKSKGDDEKVGQALHKMAEEDLTLHIGRDPQTHEMIISGLGQLHLEVVIARLKRKFGVEVIMKTPKIPYRETIKGRTKVHGRYKKQSGGRGQFGDTWLEIEPLSRDSGFEFVNKIVGGAIPKQFIPAVEKGVISAMEVGPLAGYPVVDVKVTLYDGSFHAVDSSEMAFKIAGSMGFKKGILDAKPTLLEPIMTAEIVVPDEFIGDVIGDLNSRRGRVAGVNSSPTGQVVKVKVPLAEMLKYAPDLRSMTQGRGAFDMEYSHYEEVPAQNAEKIIAANKEDKED